MTTIADDAATTAAAANVVTITDVGPTQTTDSPDVNRSVTGRMLSIACAPDGQTVYMGSYSNLWVSGDAGANWSQLTWPQPPSDQFDAAGALGGWCVVDIAVAAGWAVDRHVRVPARLTSSGRTDIVGFGECGVWTALGNGDGTFRTPNVVVPNFGFQQGWRVDQHPRFAVDLTGDGNADLLGFGDAGVWTALGNGDGTFQAPRFVLQNFGVQQGWRVDLHPRFLVDLTGDGRADIVGFGDAGVWTALGNGDGTFQEPRFVLQNFGVQQGWQVSQHPRFAVDLTGDRHVDIVGFGNAGVWTALGDGQGGFAAPEFVLQNLGVDQGWRVDSHPRFAVDLTGDGRADLVGFGDAGVWTAIGDGNGGFAPEAFVLQEFAVQQGWRVDSHPRLVVDITGDGRPDIVGFGDAGVWTARGDGNGGFGPAGFVLQNLGVQQGWRVDSHPRFAADVTGDGRADLLAFGDAGVWSARADGGGGFPVASFVLASFGFGLTVLALTCRDLAAGSAGIWRSSDGGASFQQVHRFAGGAVTGQLEWALGSDHLVYAAGGSALAVSQDGGATFTNVFPFGTSSARPRVNHVAVWQNEPADQFPAVIYALGDSAMSLSFDGGQTWMQDGGTLPADTGGATGFIANGNTPKVLAINPKFPLEVFLAGNGSGAPTPAVVHRGDFTSFPFGAKKSSWDTLPVPTADQDSGNVFLVATQHNRGDLLYYSGHRFDSSQRPLTFVGGLDPQSASDWKTLDRNVHVDLHGICLSPDFEASLLNGTYRGVAGTMWLLSDGGIYRSTDGGAHFQPGHGATTLGTTNIAGVSLPGHAPALALNAGDNSGFWTMDGGATWSYLQYAEGDNDCAYADPLRPNAMIVFSPRWDTNGNFPGSARLAQTVAVYQSSPGTLVNAGHSGTSPRHVTGPPVPAQRPVWNANSFFAERGFRPIVLTLPGETPPAQGDYIFVLDPTGPSPTLVRTQNIFDIQSRNEWNTTATGPGQGAHVFRVGPPLPEADLGIVQASGGHTSTVFFVGGSNGSNHDLWSWTAGQPAWKKLVPGTGIGAAVRWFVDPYRPSTIYALDTDHMKRSDDGGQTWHVDQSLETQLTWNGRIPISSVDNASGLDFFDLVLTDMQFDPNNASVRFAVGLGGAFVTIDGVNWTRLLHTGALPGRPTNCYYDFVTSPNEPALYVGFAGRSVVRINGLPNSVPLVAVPDVREDGVPQARAEVLAAGLVPQFSGPNQLHSWVFSQSPLGGHLVPKGTTVHMVLRTGPIP